MPRSTPNAASIDDLRRQVAAQRTALPVMYGEIDFDSRPERFTDDPDDESQLGAELAPQRRKLLENRDQVAVIEAFTMLGDAEADAYAALLPEIGFQRLVQMLDEACDHGIDAVEDAPDELVALIADMERTPDWLDMELVELGARLDRNLSAHVSPYAIRGAFVATFMNAYAALPMAITGALGEDMAANRIKETATFFTCTVLPGALGRHGPGFKAAAKVRLMHSMVRFNVLRRGKWDSTVYGVPDPPGRPDARRPAHDLRARAPGGALRAHRVQLARSRPGSTCRATGASSWDCPRSCSQARRAASSTRSAPGRRRCARRTTTRPAARCCARP